METETKTDHIGFTPDVVCYYLLKTLLTNVDKKL